MACADVDMEIQGEEMEPLRAGRREAPIVRHYQASELLPQPKGPLHDLLKKQPAVLGTSVQTVVIALLYFTSTCSTESLQMMSGLLSVGVGFIFATTQDMSQSLCTLFRVSHLTGALFIFAGVVSSLLSRFPELLQTSLRVNCGCIIVAVTAACLISVDLAQWNQQNDQHLKMEMLELCVLGLEVLLSVILCFWFLKEKRAKSQ